MKKLVLSIVAVALTVFGLGGVAMMSPAYAADDKGAGQYLPNIGSSSGLVQTTDDQSLMKVVGSIINVVIGIVGVIAVVMMIVGGINFITSQGDTAKVTKARNTILYGVVGLVVALLAFAIVNFVISSMESAGGAAGTIFFRGF